MDKWDKQKRSEVMSKIHSKNTKPEIKLRKKLFAKGLRYRLNSTKLPGTPDIILPKYRTVIFVHGCFWHGHKNCKHYCFPKSNIQFWKNKIQQNITRDRRKNADLLTLGWNIIIVWECYISKKNIDNEVTILLGIIKNNLLFIQNAPSIREFPEAYGEISKLNDSTL